MKYLNKKIICLVLLNFILFSVNVLPLLAIAAESSGGYTLLEPSVLIDQQAGTQSISLKDYLKTAYLMLFILVVSAVIFWLILAGLEYILTDTLSAKLGAKKKFWSAIFGLAIALSSVLLLKLINPDLLNFSLDLKKIL